MNINQITGSVVNTCLKIHSRIGPGCFEKVYEEILFFELIKLGYYVERQLLLDIDYDELHIKKAYKIDLLIEQRLVLELKSVCPMPKVYFKQVKTQLSLLNLKHGMLLNFKVDMMKEGIYRIFNNFGRESLNDQAEDSNRKTNL
ncbi:MAG TPA: GxxExxY protein [Chitinophagaceae bacterium]|nr:GxxExxY protein [Chitinophagaceae bacterium]